MSLSESGNRYIERKEVVTIGTGYLQVHLTTAGFGLPVTGAKVNIYDMQRNLIDTLYTDESGLTPNIALAAPSPETQFDPSQRVRPYSKYIVEIIAQGFHPTIIEGVQIFGDSESVLPIDLHVNTPDEIPHLEEYVIGENALLQEGAHENQEIPPPFVARIHRQVFIPTHITVHLGAPASNARNVTVRFIDYVKNVASSEIFPDWPYHSLRANIHAQISIALNRVFTEWYRGKGYNFDITNSTQYDQYFVENRNIYASVSAIADEIFNSYIVRPPGIEPFFSEFCNGTTVTCPGMKQWGTVTLANQGRNYLEILRYYYGSSVYIQSTENILTPFESFPGNLFLGYSGKDVALIQSMLARIRRNYPLIPAVSVDGQFGSQTAAAVRQFQQIFGIAQTGTVDRRTWYAISNIFSAVTRLAELGSEGFQPPSLPSPTPTSPQFPGTALRLGSRGSNVMLMQQYLNKIRTVYTAIPALSADGIFGPATQAAVLAFQRQFGLTADGIIGLNTWARIVSVYNDVVAGAPTTPPYPEMTLQLGSTGAAVSTVQERLNRAAAVNSNVPRVVVDGIFGPATQTAVMAFQRQFGLTPDGIVGPLTWTRLMQF